jgi:phage terminase small subunit
VSDDRDYAFERMVAKKPPAELTPMMKAFVREYLIDLNQTQAAIRAGAEPRHAMKLAAKWMRQGHIVHTAVARAQAERSVRTGITQDRVLQELARGAFGDPRVLFREDGTLRAPHEYSQDDAVMIEGIKTRRIVEVGPDGKMQQAEIQEVKLVSKASYLSMLMRHLGMNNDKLDVNVTPLAAALDAAYKRAALPHASNTQDFIDGEFEEVDEDQPPEDDELAGLLR